MVFADRQEAGRKLAKRLTRLKELSSKSVIVAIPRGGVTVGGEIADRLNIPLTVVVIKKLGAPMSSELAIGATTSHGKPVLDQQLIGDLGVTKEYLKKEVARKKKEARAREESLNLDYKQDRFKGRTVIVVDDGLATGQTARMAAKVFKQFKVSKLLLAVPCGATKVVEELEKEYDKVICLKMDDFFMAVGQYYQDFTPVEDKEVMRTLANYTFSRL